MTIQIMLHILKICLRKVISSYAKNSIKLLQQLCHFKGATVKLRVTMMVVC